MQASLQNPSFLDELKKFAPAQWNYLYQMF